jgi:2-oxoglutarate dehydrogenase E1 component
MYEKISKHPTVRHIFATQMIADGIISEAEVDTLTQKVRGKLDEAKHLAEASPVLARRPELPPPGIARRTKTAVADERLRELNEQLLKTPDTFTMNPKLARLFDKRRTAFEQEGAIDWAHAEALAFASLVCEGVPIRMTGQDSQRGTFSNRHLVLHDAETGVAYAPIQHLTNAQASFAVYNSPLSESAVLGFEYGYSSHAPDALVLWEAQFGDFANGAQVIIDQFIVSGGKKWGLQPSLVLLLPHGYEGQGPEHSSARLERFLQLAADDNIRVANCTTAAQYFHLLRRQAALRNVDPRPLILMTPKSLLRHPKAGSSLNDLSNGRFYRVMDDSVAATRRADIRRLVICTGKVYIDLITSVDAAQMSEVAVIRIEELYSFPDAELREIIEAYPHAQEVVWLQEEPRNMGAWSYVAPRIKGLLAPEVVFGYAGRAESASPAEGALSDHQEEQQRIIQQAVFAPLQSQTVVMA